jgi:hypothetical protein
MKRLIFIFMLVGVALTSMAQHRLESVDSAYVTNQTKNILVTYNDEYGGYAFSTGVVGYAFTIANYADTLNHVYFQGSWDKTNWVTVSTLPRMTAGNYIMYDDSPEFFYYRLTTSAASGDRATIKNIKYFEKLPEE